MSQRTHFPATHNQHTQFTRRRLLGLIAAGAGLVPTISASLLPTVARADPWASDLSMRNVWARTASPDVSVRAGPQARAERLALVRSGTALRIVGQEADWQQVYDPRSDTTGYVRADLLVRSDPPSAFAFMPEPPLDSELSTVAIAPADLPLHFYPSADPLAQATTLEASSRELIVGTVLSEEGATWFKTDDGYYLAADGLFLGAAPHDFTGRWLDVSLSGSAHVVAYDEDAPVRSFYAIKGTARYPTPLGTWSVVRRVANETMDSTTVGIPRNGPGGYYLKNVLYTQYFRGSGESLHYNWWSSAWGLPGSHGCLGLSLADSRWLWDWASIGTPVSIHA